METIDWDDELYFFTKLVNDLEDIFTNLYKDRESENDLSVKDLLRKSNNSIKGDYFLPLRSIRAVSFQIYKEKLIDNLNEIQYIHQSNIDDDRNLNLCLKRSILYKCVLNKVMTLQERYGMMELSQLNLSYLIIVHNVESKDCNALRIATIADHLISFLKVNGAKVHVNDFYKFSESSFQKSSLCTNSCKENINMVSKLLVNAAKTCEWRKDFVAINDCIVIEGKKFLKRCPFSFKFGNGVDIIKILDNTSEVVTKGAYAIHFSYCHDVHANNTFHISLQSQKCKIVESGLLIEMTNLNDSSQTFFDCQTVHFKNRVTVSVEKFMEYQNEVVLKAMSHKYSSAALSNEASKSCMKLLVDTSVKFTFLKTGANAPLKIDLFSDNLKKNDGIFIQYNFARLCNLFKDFELKVQDRIYEALPSLDKIDFELLRLEEEWNLLNFILSFPQLVKDIFCALNSQKNHFHANRISIMLTKLCHLFSLYYSRVRILATTPSSKLQKIMHARLWLLKGVHQIICNSFALINVQGIKQM